MMNPPLRLALTLCLISATTSLACISDYTPPPSQSTTPNDADASPDAPDDATIDAPDDAEPDADLCTTTCESYPNTLVSCVGTSCTYTCEDGFKARDQPASDGGCTCQVSPEVCDGLDNDCDGVIDNGLLPLVCENQQGVCLGSRATCTGDASTYTTACTPALYAEHAPTFTEDLTDDWRCDGLDTNCDGAFNTVCCPNGANARKELVFRDEAFALKRAIPASPAGPGQALLIRRDADDVRKLAYTLLNDRGEALAASNQLLWSDAQAIAATPTATGYLVAMTFQGSYSGPAGDLSVFQLPADLGVTNLPGAAGSVAVRIPNYFPGNPVVLAGSTHGLLAWTTLVQNDIHAVMACSFPLATPNVCADTANHRVLDTLTVVPRLVGTSHQDRFALAWYGRDGDKVGTLELAQDYTDTSRAEVHYTDGGRTLLNNGITLAHYAPKSLALVVSRVVSPPAPERLTLTKIVEGVASPPRDISSLTIPSLSPSLRWVDSMRPEPGLLLAWMRTGSVNYATLDVDAPDQLDLRFLTMTTPALTFARPTIDLIPGPRSVMTVHAEQSESIVAHAISLDGPNLCIY